MAKNPTRIKVALVEKNVSQPELAEKLDMSFSTINSYCANRNLPPLEVLDQKADCLNVNIKDLIAEIERRM